MLCVVRDEVVAKKHEKDAATSGDLFTAVVFEAPGLLWVSAFAFSTSWSSVSWHDLDSGNRERLTGQQ